MAKGKRKKKLKVPRKIRKRMSAKIRKMIKEWRRTGKITTSRAVYRPKTFKAAMQQATAIEYGREGIGRAGAGRKKVGRGKGLKEWRA